jgi:carboxymethylenebutenolidase
VRWAQSTKSVNTAKLGITGFCWGGRQVWLYAAHNPTLIAGVAWYGPLQRPKTDTSPNNPIDLVKEINAPVLGLYGGADPGIPVSEIEAMRVALKAAGKPSRL